MIGEQQTTAQAQSLAEIFNRAVTAASTQTKSAELFGSLAEKRQLSDEERKRLEEQYLGLQRELLNVSMEPLYQQYTEHDLSFQDISYILHMIATAGWVPDSPFPGEETARSLDFRTEAVGIGDALVPPHQNDVAELMALFSTKLDTFMKTDKPSLQEELLLCTWAYIVFVVIHPYSDGNGRTGRSIVKFLDHFFQRKRGIPPEAIAHRAFPNRKFAQSHYEMSEMMSAIIYELDLAPHVTGLDDAIIANSYDSFIQEYTQKGNADVYFAAIRTKIQTHLNNIDSVYQLTKFDKQLSPALAHMQQYEYLSAGETKPLIATEGLRKYQEELQKDLL